ncbi:signal peptidase I [Frondihabitans australicus]|uniref:Signal peptidase I n=1 Tax=Frondihabitans australicus TaxID=386892 RepID=A0A495IIH4_9MICO|nr:signal peptidase I [Frondihabitans australicus]RKR75218.1 signal peptidase [Frondihabitans australicus]
MSASTAGRSGAAAQTTRVADAERLREIVDPHHRHSSGPDPRAQDARDWLRLIVASVARGLIATVLGLAFWAAAPAVLGWHPTTVMTGSMEPRIHPGDVVVSVPVPPAKIQLGKVILFRDPAHPGELRLHRYYRVGPGGSLVTKGDANPTADATPVARSAVEGVALLRVPWIGLPILWLHEGKWLYLAITAAVLTLLLGFTGIDSDLRHGRGDPARVRRLETERGRKAVAKAEASRSAYIEAERKAITRRTIRLRARRVKRLRVAGGALALILLAGAATSMAPTPAALAASWVGTTSNPTSNLTAATAVAPTGLTCTNNADGSTVTIGWSYAGSVTPATFSVINNGTVYATAPGTSTSTTLSVTSLLGLGLATYPVSVRTDLVAGNTAWTAMSTTTVGVKVTALLGITSVRCA